MTADQREQALAAVKRIMVRGVGSDASQRDFDFVLGYLAALTPAPLPADLAAIQARADAATEGPWTIQDQGWDAPGNEGFIMAPYHDLDIEDADAEFIAHARTDVPALVAELTAARAEITRLRTVPADAACPGCGGGGYQSSFDGSSGGTCGHCAGSGVDVDGVLIKLAELRARPTLTAEEIHALLAPGFCPLKTLRSARAKLRTIAEGAGS